VVVGGATGAGAAVREPEYTTCHSPIIPLTSAQLHPSFSRSLEATRSTTAQLVGHSHPGLVGHTSGNSNGSINVRQCAQAWLWYQSNINPSSVGLSNPPHNLPLSPPPPLTTSKPCPSPPNPSPASP